MKNENEDSKSISRVIMWIIKKSDVIIISLTLTILAGLSTLVFSQGDDEGNIKTTQLNTIGFFTLDKIDNHWWLITPEGQPFFSIGLNHIDPASLRYPENIHIWEEKYNASTTEWLEKSVRVNLIDWVFF